MTSNVHVLSLAVLKSRDKISVLRTQALSLPDTNPKDMRIRTRLNFLLVTLGSSEILKFCLLSLNSLCFLGDLNENFVENEWEHSIIITVVFAVENAVISTDVIHICGNV